VLPRLLTASLCLTSLLTLPLLHASGYWEFVEIRQASHSVHDRGDKDESGISQQGLAHDHALDHSATLRDHAFDYHFRWSTPSTFQGSYEFQARLTWASLPKVLQAGREYPVRVSAQTLSYNRPHSTYSDSGWAQFGASLKISQLNSALASLDNLPLATYGHFDFTNELEVSVFSYSDGRSRASHHATATITPPAVWVQAYEWRETSDGWSEVPVNTPENFFVINITGGAAELGSSGKTVLHYVYRWVASDTPPSEPGNAEPADEDYRPALRLATTTRELDADGRASAELTAILYEYLPGRDDSSRPLANAQIAFSLSSPVGTLAHPLATTDANGQVRVTYTAPQASDLHHLPPGIPSVMVHAKAPAHDREDGLSIYFKAHRGEAWAEPAMGIRSSIAIVPPDPRFPAVITARVADDNLNPLPGETVTFTLQTPNPRGLLRNRAGRTATSVTATTDRHGLAQVHYFYAAGQAPDAPLRESITATSPQMARPAEVAIAVGLNLVFDRVENRYEGRGIVNAGERVPLAITVRDVWHPDLDLHQILPFWGPGGDIGDSPRLEIALKIENLATVPNYLLDALRLESQAEPAYHSIVNVRSFAESGVKNILWEPSSSLRGYGYPRVRPPFPGINTYQLSVALVDPAGRPVYPESRPRSSAFLSVTTGVPADAASIFLLENPLGPHTPEARLARTILSTFSIKVGGTSWGGFGLIVALADAAHAINTGDTDALVELALGEIKGQVFGDIADGKSPAATRFTRYNQLTLAEKYASLALTSHEDRGLFAAVDQRILSSLASLATTQGQRLVILQGNGSQALQIPATANPARPAAHPVARNLLGRVARQVLDSPEIEQLLDAATGTTRPATPPLQEGRILEDSSTGITSLKQGNLSLYLIPKDLPFETTQTTRTLTP
jgi:hypothetical protein